MTANCGDPSPHSDSYLEPYTSTIEGAIVNRIHVCQDGQKTVREIIFCSSEGQWETIKGSSCSATSGKKNIV